MAAWGRRRCHLRHICSPTRGLTDRKRSRRYPAQPPALPAGTARSVPREAVAAHEEQRLSDTFWRNREKKKRSKLGPHAESQPDGWIKKQTGQAYWNVAPEGHQSSVQNSGGTFSSNGAQDKKWARCGGFWVCSSSTRLVHHQKTKLLYLTDEIF